MIAERIYTIRYIHIPSYVSYVITDCAVFTLHYWMIKKERHKGNIQQIENFLSIFSLSSYVHI